MTPTNIAKNGDFDKASILRGIEMSGLVVCRTAEISTTELLEVASTFGELEKAWEDQHPEFEYLQLLESKNQRKLDVKSSSRFWHVDRSFVQFPTRFTFLLAETIEGDVTPTEFVDSRLLLQQFGSAWRNLHHNQYATHSFSKEFPRIMRLKEHSEEKIRAQLSQYPDVKHPLVRTVFDQEAVYFNELCINEFSNCTEEESKNLFGEILKALDSAPCYRHQWREGDLIVWDNFATIHRAGQARSSGVRRLVRATVGSE